METVSSYKGHEPLDDPKYLGKTFVDPYDFDLKKVIKRHIDRLLILDKSF